MCVCVCVCLCVGPQSMCAHPILRFYCCVFTWVHLGLIGKCDSDFMHSHKNKISVMLCYSLQGETGGYNRKHMWGGYVA